MNECQMKNMAYIAHCTIAHSLRKCFSTYGGLAWRLLERVQTSFKVDYMETPKGGGACQRYC